MAIEASNLHCLRKVGGEAQPDITVSHLGRRVEEEEEPSGFVSYSIDTSSQVASLFIHEC